MRAPRKPILTVKGVLVAPIIIQPVTQLPLIDSKKLPQTVITYQGKEIVDEMNKVGRLTHSARCFVPEGVRKSKPMGMASRLSKNPSPRKKLESFCKR